LILPKVYGTLDSEFNAAEQLGVKLAGCRNFTLTQYMHFSAKGKPWTRGANRTRNAYSEKYYPSLAVRKSLTHWFKLMHNTCPQVIKEEINLLL